MTGEENLIPFDELTEDKQREIARKGGKASGKARREKAKLKKAINILLEMDMPESKLKKQIEAMGLDTSMSQGLALSVILTAMKRGSAQDLKIIADLAGETSKEEQARVKRLNAETKRIEEETERKSGRIGNEEAEAQTKAIADLINNPQTERVLSDFMEADNDTILTTEQKTE